MTGWVVDPGDFAGFTMIITAALLIGAALAFRFVEDVWGG